VWRGGTLDQHFQDDTEKLDHGASGTFAHRRVQLLEGSWLSSVLGESSIVSCHHHQSLRVLGDGLRAVAWAEDGVVEAVELEGQGLVQGVQWHPEESDGSSLFGAFIDRCTTSSNEFSASGSNLRTRSLAP
jgi:putative glutamine amidotransferase